MKRRNKIKGLLLVAILALVAVFGIACNDKVSSATAISITGTPENGVAVITDTENTLQLGATLTGGGGKVQWSSGDADVATVDNSGKVTLIDSGAVVITASVAENAQVTASALLTVTDERTLTDTIEITNAPAQAVNYADGSVRLSAVCSDDSATLVWVSSNEGVAKVDETGLVTFCGRGETDITVYKKGRRALRATAAITVKRYAESLTIEGGQNGKIVAGYDYALQATSFPLDVEPYTLTWSVDDQTVAEISESGAIRGKKNGTVTVTAQIEDGDVKTTQQIQVIERDAMSEDFTYAVPAGTFEDASLNYVPMRISGCNLDFYTDEYDGDKKQFSVEKNTTYAHWVTLNFGDWNLTPGKYSLVWMLGEDDVSNAAKYFSPKLRPLAYKDGKIRPDYIDNMRYDYGLLEDCEDETQAGKYVLNFELQEAVEHFCIQWFSEGDAKEQFVFHIKQVELSLTGFAVDTDIYSDGVLVLGEEYTFVPALEDVDNFTYTFDGNDDGIVELKDGKLTAKKVGGNVKLTVSAQYNGNTLTKIYNLSVMENPFDGTADTYQYVTDIKHTSYYFDVRRTKYYVRTNNLEITKENNSLKLEQVNTWNSGDHIFYELGALEAGKYRLSITMHGMPSDFAADLYGVRFKEGMRTNYSENQNDWREWAPAKPLGSLATATKTENGDGTVTYTFELTLPKKESDFGYALYITRPGGYELYLDSVDFTAVREISVNTNMYSDGKLIVGEEYSFTPSMSGVSADSFTYRFGDDGTGTSSEVIKIEGGKLTALKAGTEKLTVSTTYNGQEIKKVYELEVIANPFTNTTKDTYEHAVDVKETNGYFEIQRTKYAFRTNNLRITKQTEGGLKLEKNSDANVGDHIFFEIGSIEAGKYRLAITLHGVTAGFAAELYGVQYNEAWRTNFGAQDTWRTWTPGQALSTLANADTTTTNDDGSVTYTFELNLTENKTHFGYALYMTIQAHYELYLDSIDFTAVREITVDTNMYSDGKLIVGEEYGFTPSMSGVSADSFTYRFGDDGTGTSSEVIKIENGKLKAEAVGTEKLTVSTTYNGQEIKKVYELEVIANPFTNTTKDTYEHAVDVKETNGYWDVRRTKYYLRTNDIRITCENGSLKLTKNNVNNPGNHIFFDFGAVKAGTYTLSFEMRGGDLTVDKFQGELYGVRYTNDTNMWNYELNQDVWRQWDERRASLYDNGVKNGNTYTFTVTVGQDETHYGFALYTYLTNVNYEFWLDSVDFHPVNS